MRESLFQIPRHVFCKEKRDESGKRDKIFVQEYKAVHWPYQAPVQAVSSRCFKYRREDIGWDADIAHEISGYVRKHNFANPTRPWLERLRSI